MKQIALFGMGRFGVRVLEELLNLDVEIVVIDRDRDLVEAYKDRVSDIYVLDLVSESRVNEMIPSDIDAAVVDMGDNFEATILVVHYLKKAGVDRILVRASSDQQAEVLRMAGADTVIDIFSEAAIRVVPPLVSEAVFRYLPVSSELVIAELRVPDSLVGRTLEDAQLRTEFGLNVLAVRFPDHKEFAMPDPSRAFEKDSTVLVVGPEDSINVISGGNIPAAQSRRRKRSFLRRFFDR